MSEWNAEQAEPLAPLVNPEAAAKKAAAKKAAAKKGANP